MGREPREWDEEYILGLPVGEHGWVEAKGRRAIDLTVPGVEESRALREMSKAVSAFANSGGGVLLLGVRESATDWSIDDGGVALAVKGRTSTREWLEDVIPNLVDGPLVDFDVYVVTRGSESSQIAEGRGVFVVEIRDSEQAPHQARDNVYYARVGGKSLPIGHKLVMDIFNRRRHPKMELEVEFHVVRQRKRSSQEVLGIASSLPGRTSESEIEEVIEVHLAARNVGRVLVDYMHCFVWMPKVLAVGYGDEIFRPSVVEIDGTEYVVWERDNIERDITGYSRDGSILNPERGPSWYKRILPSLAYRWQLSLGNRVEFGLLRDYFDEYIHWELLADNAPVEKGKIRIGDVRIIRVDKTVRR